MLSSILLNCEFRLESKRQKIVEARLDFEQVSVYEQTALKVLMDEEPLKPLGKASLEHYERSAG
jgi:hypothetical protein